MSEIQFLKSKLVGNTNLCEYSNQTLGSDFRQCLKPKLFGNRTVVECLKSIQSSEFRHTAQTKKELACWQKVLRYNNQKDPHCACLTRYVHFL